MRAVGRGMGLVVAGALALIAIYAGFFTLYDPRETPVAPLTLSRTPETPGQASFLFAGDTAEAHDALPFVREHGLLYPFGSTMDLVRAVDVAVVNAEAPITDGGTRFPAYKDFYYRAPAGSAGALADAGFDVVGLANNHAYDYGPDGLVDTLANVAAAGLVPLGAGRDAADARRGVVVDVGGIRVGLLAYCAHDVLWNLWVDQFAHRHHPGVAAAFDRAVAEDIARLRRAAQLVVVSFHTGDNYAPPTPSTIAWSRRAVDLGADLVVNHHPHVAHPLMIWHKKPIVLSLGNYAFGTEARTTLDYGYLALARARRCKDGGAAFERVEIVPLAVQNRRVSYRPELLHDDELAAVLARLGQDSAAFGAHLTIEAGRAVLPLEGCS
jgi:hypothetical protein